MWWMEESVVLFSISIFIMFGQHVIELVLVEVLLFVWLKGFLLIAIQWNFRLKMWLMRWSVSIVVERYEWRLFEKSKLKIL